MTKTMKFEDALRRLEEIVQKMDAGDIELETALGLFEEGVKLVRQCSSRLDEAKKKVEILVKKGDVLVPELFEQKNSADDDDR